MQIVIKCDCIGLESSSTASAQGWDVEVNPYHCKDDGGWFWSSIPCDQLEVLCYKCHYCGAGFETDFARYQHEATCPNRPSDGGNDDKPTINGGSSGGGGSGNDDSKNNTPQHVTDLSKNIIKGWKMDVLLKNLPNKTFLQPDSFTCAPTCWTIDNLLRNAKKNGTTADISENSPEAEAELKRVLEEVKEKTGNTFKNDGAWGTDFEKMGYEEISYKDAMRLLDNQVGLIGVVESVKINNNETIPGCHAVYIVGYTNYEQYNLVGFGIIDTTTGSYYVQTIPPDSASISKLTIFYQKKQ